MRQLLLPWGNHPERSTVRELTQRELDGARKRSSLARSILIDRAIGALCAMELEAAGELTYDKAQYIECVEALEQCYKVLKQVAK